MSDIDFESDAEMDEEDDENEDAPPNKKRKA